MNRSHFPPVDTHFVQSKHVRQTFKIQVMQPPQPRLDTQRFPVVYATDGNFTFDLFKGICWPMQASKHELPPFILVAIGYPGDSPVSGELLRGRDLAFPGCPDYLNGFTFLWDDVLLPEEGAKRFGGAEDFQKFIGDELIPLIDDKYGTLRGDRTYFGHSLGGGFGLFTLFTQTHLFRRYIVSSPTLTYHGVTPVGTRYDNHDFMLRRARDFIASGASLDGIRLHMSVGGEEEFDPVVANWQFTSSFYRMATLMKGAAIPGLQLTSEVFAGRTHTTVWPDAVIHGIRAVLGNSMTSEPAAAASHR